MDLSSPGITCSPLKIHDDTEGESGDLQQKPLIITEHLAHTNGVGKKISKDDSRSENCSSSNAATMTKDEGTPAEELVKSSLVHKDDAHFLTNISACNSASEESDYVFSGPFSPEIEAEDRHISSTNHESTCPHQAASKETFSSNTNINGEKTHTAYPNDNGKPSNNTAKNSAYSNVHHLGKKYN